MPSWLPISGPLTTHGTLVNVETLARTGPATPKQAAATWPVAPVRSRKHATIGVRASNSNVA